MMESWNNLCRLAGNVTTVIFLECSCIKEMPLNIDASNGVHYFRLSAFRFSLRRVASKFDVT